MRTLNILSARFPLSLLLLLVLGCLFGGLDLAVAAPAELVLGSEALASEPIWETRHHTDGTLTVRLRVPSLQVETVVGDGTTYQALTLPGGGLRGRTGEPGLPTLSRLLAVPSGAEVSLQVVSEKRVVLATTDVLAIAKTGAALADDDTTGGDRLTTVDLYA